MNTVGGKFFQDEATGNAGRNYSTDDIVAQGGYEDRGSQLARFQSQSGDQLSSLQAVVDQINLENPDKLALVERGRIKVRTGQTARMLNQQGGISGLRQTPERLATAGSIGRLAPTAFGRAKEHADQMAQFGMVGDLQDALTSGDAARAHTLSEHLYRRGMKPEQIDDIAKGVANQQKALNPTGALPPEQQQGIMEAFHAAAGDPQKMYELSTQLDSMGLAHPAQAIRAAAGTFAADSRAQASQAQSERHFQQQQGATAENRQYSRGQDKVRGARDEARFQMDQRKMQTGETRAAATDARAGRAEGRAEQYLDLQKRSVAGAGASRAGKPWTDRVKGAIADLKSEAQNSLGEPANPAELLYRHQKLFPERAADLKATFEELRQHGASGYAAMIGALRSVGSSGGGDYEAPIDWKRPVLQNPDGTSSTESSMGIEEDGKYINIATVIGGKRYSPDEAVRMYHDGKNPPLGIYGSQESADRAATARHNRWEDHGDSEEDVMKALDAQLGAEK